METSKNKIKSNGIKAILFWTIGISILMFASSHKDESLLYDFLFVLSAIIAGIGFHFSILLLVRITVSNVKNKLKKL